VPLSVFKQWVIKGVFKIQNARTINMATRQFHFPRPEK